MRKQCHIKIFGKVQGVFFRAETQSKACEFGLTGLVRNTENNAVEVLAEGEELALQKFLDWCKKGPSNAEVTEVKTEWREPSGEFRDFTIHY